MKDAIIPPIALNLPENPTAFVGYGRHKVQCFTGNKDLANPTPAIPQVTTDFDALEGAEVDVVNRVPGAVALRVQCYATCESDMKQWLAYTHSVCLANQARAAQILASSGFDQKKLNPHKKGDFEVTFPGLGIAHVYVKAVHRGASYEWMISLDGGATFISAGSTNRADQIFTGLKKNTEYQVKWRSTFARQTSDWTAQAYHFTQAK
jgi:hypothetical protein